MNRFIFTGEGLHIIFRESTGKSREYLYIDSMNSKFKARTNGPGQNLVEHKMFLFICC